MRKRIINPNKNTILFDLVLDDIKNNNLDKEQAKDLIVLLGSYLNLKTIAQYAKDHHISYNGAKHHRNPITILGVKFIIDND